MSDSLSKYRKGLVNNMLYAIETCLDNIILEILAPYVNSEKIADERELKKLIQVIRDENSNNNLTSIHAKQQIARNFIKDEKTLYSKATTINSNLSILDISDQEAWLSIRNGLTTSVNEIRNKSFHNDEITEEMKDTLIDFCSRCAKTNVDIFKNIRDELKQINPILVEEESTANLFNFPTPDYIWHKFVGRKEIYKSVLKYLEVGKPQINIYGPGGYGKSAFVDYLSRQLDQKNQYDKIIWHSDKREVWNLDKNKITQLTQEKSLEDFIKNPIGDDSYNFYELTKKFRCLIIFDNLETMTDEAIRFIDENSTPKTQFITTSRTMPESGSNLKLTALMPEESIILLKDINKSKLLEELEVLTDDRLHDIVENLNNSPLYIKWFIESIARGKSVDVLPKDQTKIAEFCFKGLIENLEKEEKDILKVVNCFNDPFTVIQISHVASLPIIQVDEIVQKLFRKSLIKKNIVRNSSQMFSIANDIKPLLKDITLGELKDTLKIEADIKEMNLRMSRVNAEIQENQKNFNMTESFEIDSKDDVFLCWRVNEIHAEYKENTKSKKISTAEAYRKQNESFEMLLEQFPNDSQVNMFASIAYNYSRQYEKAKELALRAYDTANTDFKKKKALFFLGRLHDHDKNYQDGVRYTEELYNLDKGKNFASISEHCQMLLGLNLQWKALELLENSIKQINIESEHQANMQLMLFFKNILSILFKPPEKLEESHFERIYSILEKLMPIIGKYADKTSIIEIVKIFSKFSSEYRDYINDLFKEESLNINELVNKLIKTATINKKNIGEHLSNINFNDHKNVGDILEKLGEEKNIFDSSILKEAYESDIPFEAKVVDIISGKSGLNSGYRIQLDDNAKLNLNNRAINHALELNKKYKFIITNWSDEINKPVKFSIYDESLSTFDKEIIKKNWDMYYEGMIVNAEIKSITGYGIFMKLNNYVDGLLHKNQIDSGIYDEKTLKEKFKKGQQLKVKIIDIQKEEKFLSLSLRAVMNENAWKNVNSNYKKGEIYEGIVTKVSKQIIWIYFEDGITSSIKPHEITYNCKIRRNKDYTKIINVGDDVKVKVLDIVPDKKHMYLSLKQTKPNPYLEFKKANPINSQIEGKISKIANVGIFVQFSDEIEGLIHKSKISVGDLEKYKTDQKITCTILNIHPESNKIELKPYE